MAVPSPVRCDVDSRREELLARRRAGSSITGIDYIVVAASQRSLDVYFIDSPPPTGLVGRPDRVAVVGGRRVRVRVTDVTAGTTGGRPHLVVALDQPGDFSDYTLEIEAQPDLDELYRRCTFNFKVACPARFDCRPPAPTETPPPPGIEVDYMAKDYASFRQALVDLAPRLTPRWTERLAADMGMAVLELLAYGADQLSYYQDAVANEAFLETARHRISVRRHARLVDYAMHDGVSARALVHLQVDAGPSVVVDRPLEVLGRIVEPLDGETLGPLVPEAKAERARRATSAVFRTRTGPEARAVLDARLNRLSIHDWGGEECVLPAGATTLDLVGDVTDVLGPGDLLLLEEVLDPTTLDPGLADPSHRQVVRVTHATALLDNLLGESLTRVEWDEADALGFSLCVATRGSGDVSVSRANLMVADLGRSISESGLAADPILSGTGVQRFKLSEGPLSFWLPAPDPSRPAAELFLVDPQTATPQVERTTVSGTVPDDDWQPFPTLLDSRRFDHHFAVETDDDGRALLRFGDDTFGEAPPAGASYSVDYLVGVGPEGNVGPEALAHVVERTDVPTGRITAVRNPIAAWGGTAPESPTRVKRIAPAAFRARQERAVTEPDYAEVAARHVSVRSAVARLRWTGSWHTVFVSVDPEGRLGLSDREAEDIRGHVLGYAQAGYDVRVIPPVYVPLRIELEICAEPEHFRAYVEERVRAALTTGLRPDGTRGFFHPDNFTFGQPLFLSSLYTAVADAEGVESVVAVRFARLSEDEPSPLGPATTANLDLGRIPIDALEVLRLDDDRDFPEHGLLHLSMRGGR